MRFLLLRRVQMGAVFGLALAQACAAESAGKPSASVTEPPAAPAADLERPVEMISDTEAEATPVEPSSTLQRDAGIAAPDAATPVAGSGGGDAAAGPVDAAATSPEEPVAEPAVDSAGCPLSLEGFAALGDERQGPTTGGAAGETVTVRDQAELSRYASADEPYVIRVMGALKIEPKGKEIPVASHKTIIGVGDNAEIFEGGFNLGVGVHNVILRNLQIHGTLVQDDWEGKTQDYDGVQMDTAHHVWIDHCHFHHIGDGIIDSRKDTSYLTVSWNILSDHNKAFGIGWTENVTAQLTIHHNWFRDVNQRNPSTDNVLRAHLYNNWLQRLASYGNYARGATNMVLENSVFESVKDPHYFDTGSLVAIDNEYVATTGKRSSSGARYDVFDPHTFYEYTLTPTAEVPALLTRCAGPRATLGL